MPTPAIMHLPKTKSSEEFEHMCRDILDNKFKSRFEIYGRNGQCQHGIDIYNKNLDNYYIVAQCKNYLNENSGDQLIKNIKKDIDASNQLPFYSKINKFIAMTSMDSDNKVQNEILSIKKNFDIEVWFWENIQEEICSNNYLLEKYYSKIFISNTNTVDVDRLKDDFNSLMSEANILEFIHANPFIKIEDYLPESVDIFNIEMTKKLNSAVILQNEEIFKAINKFISKLNDYNVYLSSLAEYTLSGDFMISKIYTGASREKIRNEINKRKSELNNIYSRINENCSLFY
ncbi:hypothetical protein [Peptacetobacter hiranonis]|uniref:hypothetical protein n=1 Tax=Peptacetobacter hiranonis TaxID=89152 RepID=UPI003D816007